MTFKFNIIDRGLDPMIDILEECPYAYEAPIIAAFVAALSSTHSDKTVADILSGLTGMTENIDRQIKRHQELLRMEEK
jgi:hypothetical protein